MTMCNFKGIESGEPTPPSAPVCFWPLLAHCFGFMAHKLLSTSLPASAGGRFQFKKC